MNEIVDFKNWFQLIRFTFVAGAGFALGILVVTLVLFRLFGIM